MIGFYCYGDAWKQRWQIIKNNNFYVHSVLAYLAKKLYKTDPFVAVIFCPVR